MTLHETIAMQTPVRFVKRIGERIAAGLHERGIETVEDLLYHLPFRYEDRLHPKPLSAYQPGEMASVIGEVRGAVLLRTRSGPIFEMTVGVAPIPPVTPIPHVIGNPDTVILSEAARSRAAKSKNPVDVRPTDAASGFSTTNSSEPSLAGLLRPPPIFETVKCLWFHGSYLKDKFRPGQRIALYGKLEGSRSGNALNAPPGSTKFKMVQPTFEILPDASSTGEDAEFTTLEMGRIVPVYPSVGGTTPWGAKLTSRWLRRVMWTIFKELKESGTQRGGDAADRAVRASWTALAHGGAGSNPLPCRRHLDDGVNERTHAGASPADLRRALVSRAWTRAETAKTPRTRRHGL